jgi:m7GpppX diphosphatase
LDHKKESERIVYEDADDEEGFILLPDIKWDGVSPNTLYLQAIVRTDKLKSLRDLTGAHRKMLENIREKSLEVIKGKYGLEAGKLRLFLHYQPSFYHLHIHVNHVANVNQAIEAERAHLLDHVIENLKLVPDYYQRASLTFPVKKDSELYKIYEHRFVSN